MEKILIVEDDEKIARVIQLELEFEGYITDIAYTGKEALEKYETGGFSLMLLDVMIPELNGLEVLRRIRQKNSDIKIIMLTARDAVMDKVSGLDSGANDYMTKPFEVEELLARIRVHLKSAAAGEVKTESIKYRHLEIRPLAREVYSNGAAVYLTQKEYDVLLYLINNKNHALSRDQIIEDRKSVV